MGAYTSDNALCKKWSGRQTALKLSVENFDGENVDGLIKVRQIHQYFPLSKFCAIQYT